MNISKENLKMESAKNGEPEIKTLHSILSTGGGRQPKRQESARSINVAKNTETAEIPDPEKGELPDFCDEEEKQRALKAAKEMAQHALNQQDDENTEPVSGPCFACCSAPPEAPSEAETEGPLDLEEETVARMSSKKLNSLIEKRLSRELSRSVISREDSHQIDKGIVSFGTFMTVRSERLSPNSDKPVPLTNYLPPSPFFTFNGTLGVDCMAFQLDFTDKLNNIVPPFFLREGEEMDERAQNILKTGVSYAREIDMFASKDLDFLNEDEPPSAAHMDLMEDGDKESEN